MKPNRFTYRIFVNRQLFRVTVKKLRGLSYETVSVYPCAVGMEGHRTPGGVYKIKAKVLNPPWYLPNAEWVAPEKRGTVIAGGDPANPIKGAFLQVTANQETGNVGIHGTGDMASLGSAASHGCIRVDPSVAVHLYHVIPKHTRIEIL